MKRFSLSSLLLLLSLVLVVVSTSFCKAQSNSTTTTSSNSTSTSSNETTTTTILTSTTTTGGTIDPNATTTSSTSTTTQVETSTTAYATASPPTYGFTWPPWKFPTPAPTPPPTTAAPTLGPNETTAAPTVITQTPPTTSVVNDPSELYDTVDIQFECFYDQKLPLYLALFKELTEISAVTQLDVKQYMGYSSVLTGEGFVMTVTLVTATTDDPLRSIKDSKVLEAKLNDRHTGDSRIRHYGIKSARRVGEDKRLTEDNFRGVDYFYIAVWIGTVMLVMFSLAALFRKRRAEYADDDDEMGGGNIGSSSAGGMHVPDDDTHLRDERLEVLLDKAEQKHLEDEEKFRDEHKFAPSPDLFVATLEYETRIKLPPKGASLLGRRRLFDEYGNEIQENNEDDEGNKKENEKNNEELLQLDDQEMTLILNEKDLAELGDASISSKKNKLSKDEAASIVSDMQKTILEELGEATANKNAKKDDHQQKKDSSSNPPSPARPKTPPPAVDAANTNFSEPQANPFGQDNNNNVNDPLATNNNNSTVPPPAVGQFFKNMEGIEKPEKFIPRFSARAMMSSVMMKGMYGDPEDYSSVQPSMFLRPAGTLPVGSKEAALARNTNTNASFGQNNNSGNNSGVHTPQAGRSHRPSMALNNNNNPYSQQNQNQNQQQSFFTTNQNQNMSNNNNNYPQYQLPSFGQQQQQGNMTPTRISNNNNNVTSTPTHHQNLNQQRQNANSSSIDLSQL